MPHLLVAAASVYGYRIYDGEDEARKISDDTKKDTVEKFCSSGRECKETLHNGTGDAWRHAEWNRRMSNELGADRAFIYGLGHEVWDNGIKTPDKFSWGEFKMDMWNNWKGINAENIDDLIRKNELIIIKGKDKNRDYEE